VIAHWPDHNAKGIGYASCNGEKANINMSNIPNVIRIKYLVIKFVTLLRFLTYLCATVTALSYKRKALNYKHILFLEARLQRLERVSGGGKVSGEMGWAKWPYPLCPMGDPMPNP
jgi:hypothetical protein